MVFGFQEKVVAMRVIAYEDGYSLAEGIVIYLIVIDRTPMSDNELVTNYGSTPVHLQQAKKRLCETGLIDIDENLVMHSTASGKALVEKMATVLELEPTEYPGDIKARLDNPGTENS